MNLTVGRVSLGDVDVSWDMAGSTLTVSGSTKLLADFRIKRTQLLGYVDNPDEPFVPVVSGDEPDVDGFYRVTGASFGGTGNDAFRGDTKWSVQLARVTSHRHPLIELSSIVGFRLGSPVITDGGYYRVAIPPSARLQAIVTASGASTLTEVLPDGLMLANWILNTTTRYMYTVKPSGFYEGAGLLAADGVVKVGRGTSQERSWTIHGGRTELKLTLGTTTTTLELRHKTTSTSGWGTWRTYTLGASDGGFATDSVTILRNGPECVSIRLNGLYRYWGSITLTLRRAASSVLVRAAHADPNASSKPRVGSAEAAAATSEYSGKGWTDGTIRLMSAVAVETLGAALYQPVVKPTQPWEFMIGPATGNSPAQRHFEIAASERQAVVVP